MTWLDIGWHFDIAIGVPILCLCIWRIVRLNRRM